MILHLPENICGRDFVVGDLHGCLDLLLERLDSLRFDPSIDRLFSVGDLIDRGPDSIGCLRLLREPWFFSVRGNHEQMLLGCTAAILANDITSSATRLFLNNGGQWLAYLQGMHQSELWQDLLPLVQSLPYVISVGQGRTRFNVVHAELMISTANESVYTVSNPQVNLNIQNGQVLTDAEILAENLVDMVASMTWGRRLVRADMHTTEPVFLSPAGPLAISPKPWYPGLSLTYAGHSILPCMRLHASHLFIDCGAFRRVNESHLQLVCHNVISEPLIGIFHHEGGKGNAAAPAHRV